MLIMPSNMISKLAPSILTITKRCNHVASISHLSKNGAGRLAQFGRSCCVSHGMACDHDNDSRRNMLPWEPGRACPEADSSAHAKQHYNNPCQQSRFVNLLDKTNIYFIIYNCTLWITWIIIISLGRQFLFLTFDKYFKVMLSNTKLLPESRTPALWAYMVILDTRFPYFFRRTDWPSSI